MPRHPHYNKALVYIKRIHAGQIRQPGSVANWHHIVRVAEVLEWALKQTGEGTEESRLLLPFAALGHDLVEDTPATEKEIRTLFTDRGWELIYGMTNPWGDDNPGPYIKKVAAADEEVRLTKLADLWENFESSGYGLTELGVEWAESYFMPIVVPMHEALAGSDFKDYPQTGRTLKILAGAARDFFEHELSRFKTG